ncbi:MAG: ABC transporter ATP-binding protein [Desulfobulbaceae bacterium]|nr:ABC transporter ATP-binding protein [Desulfobulbaceae bacterium]
MLLDIHNLHTGFHMEEGFSEVVRGISFAIDPGQTVALVGESGSGKSVTALSLLQLLDRSAASISGKIFFENQDLLLLDEPAMRRIRGNRIAMIFQEPMISLNPVYSIGDQLIEPLMQHQRLPKKEAIERGIALLERTGISEPDKRMHSFPHQLSGGQRQRVMISMALASRPALLIADEPTTALDVTVQTQILALLKDIQEEIGMAILLITHDLTMVRKIADHIHIMHQGKIVEQGETEQVFRSPTDPYTIHLLDSVPKGEPPPREQTEALVSIKDLACVFTLKAGFFRRKVGEIRAVDGASLTIREGSTYGLVGESGSGKSTLGMCILRLTGCHGRIDYAGKDLLAYSNRQMRPLRKELQVVFQDPFSALSPRLTVEQILAEGLMVHGIGGSREKRREIVEQALLEVGLEPDMADRYPHEFSGGQRQRIAIARAVVLKPRFLVLDEPTSALDMTIQAQIIDLLRRLQKNYNMTYLFISHDLKVIRALADEIAVMQNGKIVESGPAGKIFSNPEHPYTKRLFRAAFDLETL